MALKPDRKYTDGTDISYYMSEVAERGIIVIHDTDTSGVGPAMDDADASVSIPTGALGDPAGLLLEDMVSIDPTRQHINWHQDQVLLGGKVAVLRNGFVTTDMVASGVWPAPGAKAYWTTDGKLTTASDSAQVGRFLGSVDNEGFIKVEINIV